MENLKFKIWDKQNKKILVEDEISQLPFDAVLKSKNYIALPIIYTHKKNEYCLGDVFSDGVKNTLTYTLCLDGKIKNNLTKKRYELGPNALILGGFVKIGNIHQK